MSDWRNGMGVYTIVGINMQIMAHMSPEKNFVGLLGFCVEAGDASIVRVVWSLGRRESCALVDGKIRCLWLLETPIQGLYYGSYWSASIGSMFVLVDGMNVRWSALGQFCTLGLGPRRPNFPRRRCWATV